MKKSKRILIPFLFLLFAFTSSMKAQVDTVFWFAAPWVTTGHANNVPVVLRISSFSNNTTVRIQQPASTYDTTFTVAANSLFNKDLSHIINTLENVPANVVHSRGLKISSDFPITVVYEVVTTQNNPETYSLKGQNGLGTEFVAPFQTKWDNGAFTPSPRSMFCIVATQNATTVWITPKADIVGHTAGTTFSVTLNAGESYTCENVTLTSTTAGSNLSGSIIVSDKPIAVTVSDDSVADVGGGGCRDLMGDEIVPTDVIGKEYIVNKGGMNANSDEGIFVVASKNFTSITINDGTTTTVLLNQGETFYYEITQPLSYVIADKPVYVLQASGFGCELGEALLPPLNCSGSDQVSFTRTNNQTFILNILCRAGDEGAFTLNGSTTLVPTGSFTVVPGTGGAWMGAQISFNTTDIPSGVTQLLVNTNGGLFSLGVINGGSTTGCLFHYMSTFLRRVYTTAGSDQVLCSGLNAVNLGGSVTGGATTGIWTVLNGTGNLNNPTNQITTYDPSSSDTAQGTVVFVLSSTGNCEPVTDTMVVTFNPNPSVEAGSSITRCDNNLGIISISGTMANAVGSNWTSSGTGGSFTNSGSLTTNYSPSPTDIASDSITLTLTTAGNIFGCPNVSDSLVLYFVHAPLVNAGSNATVCANNAVANLDGLVDGVAQNGIWSTTGSGLINPADTILSGATYTASNSDTTLGTVVVYLTSTNNGICNAVEDSITITIIDAPTIQITNSDTLCGNSSFINLTVDVTSGFGVNWNTSGSGSFTSSTNPNTTYNIHPLDTANGGVDLMISTVAGACNSVSDTLHLVFAAPPQAYAGLDQSYCSNEVIPLNGVVTGVTASGVWTSTGTGSFNPSGSQLATSYVPSLLDVGSTINLILTTTNNQGCSPDQDTLVVNFLAPPVAAFTGDEVCLGQGTTFTDGSIPTAGTTITGWNWTFGDLNTSIAQNPIHTYSGSGTYTTTLIATASNGCSDTTIGTINVNVVPIADFSNTVACMGNITSFSDLSIITSGTIISWQYSFSDGTPNSNLQNPTHTFASNGFYPVTLVATSDKGCNGIVTHNVNVLNGPTALFGSSTNPGLAGETITFNDISVGNPVSWNWNFGDTSGTNIQNPAHIYTSGGLYNVVLTVTDQFGCSDSSSLELLIAMLPVLPTAFTPNSDDNNDIFYVRGGPFKNLLLKVYNNWGELIFSTDKQDVGWDGKFKNVDQPVGVYVWYVEVEVADGRIFKKSGDVTLLR